MSKKSNWFIANIDIVLLITVTTFFIVLREIGILKVIDVNIQILGFLIAVTVFLIARFHRQSSTLSDISENIDLIENNIKGFTVAEVLHGREDCFRALNSVVHENSKLDTTYFSPNAPLDSTLQGREEKEYWARLARNLKNSNDFVVRRLVTIENEQKYNWVMKLLDTNRDCTTDNLAVISTETSFSLMNVIVVDRKHVMLFGPHQNGGHMGYTFIRSGVIANSFVVYFNDLWSGCVAKSDILKTGVKVNEGKVEELKSLYVLSSLSEDAEGVDLV